MVRAEVSPEKIGLVGCWQVIAVRRETIELGEPEASPSDQIGFYASSLSMAQSSDSEVLEIIRQHWSASENGTHYRRDVTFEEDACRVRDRGAAEVLATLRNLALGIYELERDRGRTKVDTLASWCERQTFSTALKALRR